MSKLVVISDGLAGLAYELGSRWVTIGRGDRNAFQIVERSVSSQHCEVLLRGNELMVRDLRSTNGTFIDGETISEAVLQPGQTLRLGLVELRLEISGTAPPASSRASAKAASPLPVENPESVGYRKTYRVLFVDDSLAFLQMITELFGAQGEKNWEIHTASSADKALAILQQKLIHLVVLDMGMPLLDGAQLLGIIHRQYPNIKKVILTAQSDENRKATCLANGAELFLLKPGDEEGWRLIFNLLSNVLRWTDSNDFISALGETGLFDVIQLECRGGNSLVVEVRNHQAAGEIYIENGAIVHASAGKLLGEKALRQLLFLMDGEFRLIPFRAPPLRSIDREWESLLAAVVRAREQEENNPDDDNETILITKKMAAKQPVPAPLPPQSVPAESPQSPTRRSTSGMNCITLEELVEADTALLSRQHGQKQPSGGLKK